jgi:hypothetical protein
MSRWLVVGFLLLGGATASTAEPVRTHPPMRPLPTASQRPLLDGPRRYVDVVRGSDAAPGTDIAPWKTLQHAVRQLRPGDTLLVHGGVYHEHVVLTQSGTADAPITIRSFPGELAILDAGLPEFLEQPASSWEPYPDGAPGEYVSTRTYFELDDRQTPRQFLPRSWEPMWGIETERPIALGHFADSLVPLHSYRIAVDLRSTNEFWLGGKHEMRDSGLYCGPGMWSNRDTGRIHIRLTHHQLDGLSHRAYRGETDPRKLPLVISVGFGRDVLRLSGVRHIGIQDLVVRGATGSALINMYGVQHVEFDHVTLYGGFPALLMNASQDVRVTHSAFRGLAAPWTSRAHMKYRGTASYQLVLQDNQPLNERIEFAHCEFTDDHDFAYLRPVKSLEFHHNFVDNFNDDGLECGPKLRDHLLFVHENRIGRCLIPFTQHEIDKDESPLDHNPNAGVFAFRNVIDLRGGTYKSPPKEPDPTGSFLHQEGHLVGDHGGPIWPVMHVYHNTLLRDTPVFRDGYLFGLGSQGLRQTERDVFNNLFVQTESVPGVGFVGMKQAENVREGGNVLWGLKKGPALDRDPFAKFRASPLFLDSKNRYSAGWTTDDRIADPQFVRLSAGRNEPDDLRLQSGSPAINTGVPIPTDWPDPLRAQDGNVPDAGALPHGTNPWGVGVDGRVSLFGE